MNNTRPLNQTTTSHLFNMQMYINSNSIHNPRMSKINNRLDINTGINRNPQGVQYDEVFIYDGGDVDGYGYE